MASSDGERGDREADGARIPKAVGIFNFRTSGAVMVTYHHNHATRNTRRVAYLSRAIGLVEEDGKLGANWASTLAFDVGKQRSARRFLRLHRQL